MDNFREKEQPGLLYGDRASSPLELYTRGLSYFSVFLSGLSQMGLYLLGNYAQPGSLMSPENNYNGYIRSPATPLKSIKGTLLNEKTPYRQNGEVLSSLKQISDNYLSNNAPSVLQSIFEFVCLAYSSNFELRRHIRNINARYRFGFGDDDRQISLEIKNSGMRVFPGSIDLPDVSLKFRDSQALRKLLLSAKPDILDVILKQDVVADGNLIYLLKLLYLLNHLQFKLLGPA
jgi:hypothetical protein